LAGSQSSEFQKQRDEEQWERLEALRELLTVGVTEVGFRADHVGGSMEGIFKGFDGYRLKVADSATGVIYTCLPTQVTHPYARPKSTYR
jgi:hypothetical protein